MGGKDVRLLIMYHGAIMSGRGIERVIEIAGRVGSVGALVMGDALDQDYLESLKGLASGSPARGRVVWRGSVPHSQLWKYVGAVDVGMIITDSAHIHKSYYYSLPNKFFENIQSLTPIMITELPEMARIVNQYQIGWVVENDMDIICERVEELADDRREILDKRENLLRAKERLCWEVEKERLKSEYAKLIR